MLPGSWKEVYEPGRTRHTRSGLWKQCTDVDFPRPLLLGPFRWALCTSWQCTGLRICKWFLIWVLGASEDCSTPVQVRCSSAKILDGRWQIPKRGVKASQEVCNVIHWGEQNTYYYFFFLFAPSMELLTWDPDLNWDQESDAQPTEPSRLPWKPTSVSEKFFNTCFCATLIDY